jgi:hypothetical protein
MSYDHAKTGDTLGAELQCLRGMEATWEWFAKLSGANTYFKDKLNTVYANTVQAEDDTELASKMSLQDTSPGTGLPGAKGLAVQAKQAHDQRISDWEQYFFAFMDYLLTTSAEDQAAGGIAYDYDSQLLQVGQVKILKRRGRFAALRTQMTADSKSVQKNTVSVSGFAGDSGNVGSLVASGLAGSDHSLAGQSVWVVTDDTVGAVKLSQVLNLTTPLISSRRGGSGASSEKQFVADNPVTVGQSSEDGETGLSGLLSLDSISITGDGFSLFSSVVVSNPSEADSDKGNHYISVKHIAVGGAGPNWRISWYRSNNRSDTVDLVTTADITGESSTVAFTLNGSSSTITGTFSKANAFSNLPNLNDADTDIDFNIRSPRIGDTFRATVANDEAGNFASKLGRRYPVSLPSAASASTEYGQTKAASVAMT